jgi:phosphatidylglycerol lysyltransferase-like protein
MLAEIDLKILEEHASMYDHDWSYYSIFLGEPFLLSGCLSYYDGSILYLCAYRVRDPLDTISSSEIAELVTDFTQRHHIETVVIWGNFDWIPQVQTTDGAVLSMTVKREADPTVFDTCVDVQEFEYARHRKARLALNAVRRSGLTVRTVQREHLTAAHLKLIYGWLEIHAVSTVHLNFVTAVVAEIRDPRASIIEAHQGNDLLGFALLSQPTKHFAILLQVFSDRSGTSRVGDAIYAHIIDEVRARGVSHLSLGYSATDSLLTFKRKWGATIDFPPYREALLTTIASHVSAFEHGMHPWQQRMFFDNVQVDSNE